MTTGGLFELLASERDSLLRYLGLRGATIEEAEDILHDVYLKLSETETGPIAQPMAYLFKMATNAFLMARRGATRRIRREEGWAGATGDESGASREPSAEDSLIARERLAAVQRAVGGLPPRTQAIFRRFRLDGASQRAIAAEMGVSVSAVEKHLQRAYRTLAEVRAALDADLESSRHPRDNGGSNGP